MVFLFNPELFFVFLLWHFIHLMLILIILWFKSSIFFVLQVLVSVSLLSCLLLETVGPETLRAES